MKGKIELYRNNQFEGYLSPANANIYQTLMGVFYIELEIVDINDLQLGDEIKLEFNNEMFTFIVTEMNDKLIRAEHKSYILRNYVVIDKFFNTPPTYDTHIEFADIDLNSVLDGFLKPLMQDINFDIENNSSSIELKDIAFSNDNLLSAIQKICDVFNVEFKRHDDYIEFVDRVGVDTDITINAGIESKNIVKMIDTSNIVTRIYPLGSSQNLPDNYYYKNLRISQFNMTTGIHTGNLYLENSEGIAKYGIIEQTVEFPDVKLQSKKGTIDYSGREIIEDLGKEYIYIRSEDFANIDETKVINLTMLIVDGLKMAELPIIKASNSEKKIWISQTLKDGSTLSWLPSSGSFYTIVGYITQTEMNNARQELENKAMQYLEDNSEPKVIYEVNSVYIQEKEFEVGDRLTLHDFKQNIDTQVRVVEIQKDLIKNLYTTLKFANKVEKIPYSFIKEQQEMKERMKEITVNLTDIASTSRQALERHNLLVRNNFYGSENEYVLIGSEARNYALKGLTITPDDGTNGKVTWTAFTFQEISNDSAYNCGSGNQTLSTNVYYIFIRIQKGDYGNTSGNNKLVFSTTKLENTATYNYYPLGMAEFDGTRTKIATSYGFTLIDGNFIKTGTISADKIKSGILTSVAMDGTEPISKFNLDNGTFKVGKRSVNKYIEYNGTDLIIKGGVLEATNAYLWSDSNILVTVGTRGTFQTLNQALEFMSKFMIIHHADGQQLKGEIKILSGTTISERIALYDVNLGWVTITSEDSTVYVNFNESSPFLYIKNSVSPKIGTLFSGINSEAPIWSGMQLVNSSVFILHNCGFTRFYTNLRLTQNSFAVGEDNIISSHGDFKSCLVEESFLDTPRLDAKGGLKGLNLSYGAKANIRNLDITGSTTGVYCNYGSQIFINYIPFTSSGTYNLYIDKGSIISVNTIYGVSTLSQALARTNVAAFNAISDKGIIFCDTSQFS